MVQLRSVVRLVPLFEMERMPPPAGAVLSVKVQFVAVRWAPLKMAPPPNKVAPLLLKVQPLSTAVAPEALNKPPPFPPAVPLFIAELLSTAQSVKVTPPVL